MEEDLKQKHSIRQKSSHDTITQDNKTNAIDDIYKTLNTHTIDAISKVVVRHGKRRTTTFDMASFPEINNPLNQLQLVATAGPTCGLLL